MRSILEQCWSKDTCYPKLVDKWSEERPETGQCAITCLLVQDLLGGTIVKDPVLNHFGNVVNGDIIDLTSKQWIDGEVIKFTETINRDELLKNLDTFERYQILKFRYLNKLGENLGL